jgi:subtilase family serine protease
MARNRTSARVVRFFANPCKDRNVTNTFSRLRILFCAGGLAVLASCSSSSTPTAPILIPATTTPTTPVATSANVFASCSSPEPGDEDVCYSVVRTDIGAGALGDHRSILATTVSGYGPSDLQSAYKLPSSTAGAGQTVGIVDAYDDPTAESDLAVYRSHYGLPACTTANGCFKKVGQTGGAVPRKNASWAEEISLDLDMVSAVCPNCHILLVEATSATNANLAAAVNEAAKLGATEISNSYGGSESGSSNAAYNHPGIVITASAGDSGTGASQPASYSTVVAVGGTSLSKASNARGWSETAWTDSGSGCSAYVAKPTWQTDKGCTKRSEADVSSDADPNTGVAVYDSTPYQGYSGWLVFGGTSVSSPTIASVFALAGNASSVNAGEGIWNDAGAHLFDVTSGSNGSCSISYICNAGAGYDGPTGWGTPNGVGAF